MVTTRARFLAALALAVTLPIGCAGGGGNESGGASDRAANTSDPSDGQGNADGPDAEATNTEAPAADGDLVWMISGLRQVVADGGRLYGMLEGSDYEAQLVSIDTLSPEDVSSGDAITEFTPTLAAGESASTSVGSSGAWADAQPSGGLTGSTEFRVWHTSDGKPVVVGRYEIESSGNGVDAGRNEANLIAFDGETREQLWVIGPQDGDTSEPGALFQGVDGVGVAEVCTAQTERNPYCGVAGIDPATGTVLWAKDDDAADVAHVFTESGDFLAVPGSDELLSFVSIRDGAAKELPNGTEISASPRSTACAASGLALVPGYSNLRAAREATDLDAISAITAVDARGDVAWSIPAGPGANEWCSADEEVALVRPIGGDELWLIDTATGEARWTLDAEQADRFTPSHIWSDGVVGRTPTGFVSLALDDGTQRPLAEDDWRVTATPWDGVFDEEAQLAMAITPDGLVAWHASQEPVATRSSEGGSFATTFPVFAGG